MTATLIDSLSARQSSWVPGLRQPAVDYAGSAGIATNADLNATDRNTTDGNTADCHNTDCCQLAHTIATPLPIREAR